jgi:hypothetical protein
MRTFKGSFVGLVLAGILLLAPTAAFAHGGGGHGGGGGFGGGGGHFGGGGAHFGGFAGHGFAGHSFGQFSGAHFARYGDHFRHGRGFFFGGPYWDGYPYYGDDYPYYGDDYPYYGYYDDGSGDYVYGQASPTEVSPSQNTVIAVQKELTRLGYYHGQVDGLVGPETERAVRWFQSVDHLTVTGQIDEPTLRALQIS